MMRLLKLDPEYRHYLIVKHALEIDKNGDETLVGLTATESAEYAAVISAMYEECSLADNVYPERFLMLYERHIEALPHDASVFEIGRPSSW